jgi:hypothetical protein
VPKGDPSHRQKKELDEGERLEEDVKANGPSKQAEVAILILNKVDYTLTLIK